MRSDVTGHPVHPEAVHTGVLFMAPVRENLHLDDLEGFIVVLLVETNVIQQRRHREKLSHEHNVEENSNGTKCRVSAGGQIKFKHLIIEEEQ